METPEIHVEELKKDPEFLANIKRLEELLQVYHAFMGWDPLNPIAK